MGSTLTLLDVTGIQSFIFGSNRLAENVGASYLVKQALGDWLSDEVRGVGGKLLFSGGGNALVSSSSLETAKALVTGLHLRLVEESPGLGLVCAHRPDGAFEETYKLLHDDLRHAKSEKLPDVGFDGAGVVAFAPPADSLAVSQEDGLWISESTRARREAYNSATDELHSVLRLGDGWEWSRELGKLGRSRGERSLLGVIHFDGNALGQRFQKASSSVEGLKALSDAVDEAGRQTLKESLLWVHKQLANLADELGYRDTFPVRPILYGGDDITLVCEGRIALDLASKLLERWRESTKTLPAGGSAEACAGVALVPVNYPFYRAYKLSERCCKDAKRFLHQERLNRCSALDWELCSGGTEHKRSEEHKQSSKPYLIGEHNQAHRDWAWFRGSLVHGWRKSDEKHTQLKSLAEILRLGEEDTREHLRRWKDKFGLHLPEPKGRASVNGFFDGHTPYLDALEVLDRMNDVFVPEVAQCL